MFHTYNKILITNLLTLRNNKTKIIISPKHSDQITKCQALGDAVWRASAGDRTPAFLDAVHSSATGLAASLVDVAHHNIASVVFLC